MRKAIALTNSQGRIQFAAEKLSRARHALMLPHTRGDAEDIADAFLFCSSAFELLATVNLDDRERSLFATIHKLSDTSGIENNGTDGVLMIRAARLTLDEKLELSRAVDELANRLERRYWKVEHGAAEPHA
jgi:hypothetical protein